MPTLNSLNSENPKPMWHGNTEPSREEMIIGSLLGDGHVSKDGSLAIEHSIKQREYLEWKYQYLKDICNTPPHITKKGNAIRVRTKCIFKDYRQKWYGTGRKALPVDFEYLVTPFVLAIWYMDDGDKKKSSHIGKTVPFLMDNGMRISIACFNRKEAHRIQDVFSKYGIISLIKREGKYLRLSIPASNDNSKRFADLISPFIPNCMKYKIPDFRENMRGKHGRQVYGHDSMGRFIKAPEGAETKQGVLGVIS